MYVTYESGPASVLTTSQAISTERLVSMLNLDCTILSQVVSKALADAAGHPRWVNAIRRAFEEVDSNPWIERNPNGHGLIIGSPSGACYSANGECSCPAFAFGRACWHRAAARLVRLHDERQTAVQQEGQAIADAAQSGLVTMPEGDTLDTSGMRIARKIAAARATALVNELFA